MNMRATNIAALQHFTQSRGRLNLPGCCEKEDHVTALQDTHVNTSL